MSACTVPRTVCRHLVTGRLEDGLVPGGKGDTDSFSGKRLGCRQADSTTPSCDDRPLAAEPKVHHFSFRRREAGLTGPGNQARSSEDAVRLRLAEDMLVGRCGDGGDYAGP
jgi:hypothetical protein